MNVAPTIDKPPPRERRGATCDARQRFGTPANGLARPQTIDGTKPPRSRIFPPATRAT